MTIAPRVISLLDLVEAHVETHRRQVHPIMTDHVDKTLIAYEAALGVKVPRTGDDVPPHQRALWMLFRATTTAVATLQTPTSELFEASAIFGQLAAAGEPGQVILHSLDDASGHGQGLRSAELTILEELLSIFLGGARPHATMDDVRATGLYPGATPPDFDIFDHM